MKPRYFWIGLVVALLALSVGVHAVLLIASINDPSFAVEPDYERKARNYDEIQRQREASRALGWMADLTWDGQLCNGVRIYDWQDYRNGLMASAGFAVLAVLGAWRLRETDCRNQTLNA